MTAAPRLSTPLRWLLVASLALNLLVGGLVAGALLDDDGPGRRFRPVELALGPFARALEEEDRRAVLASLRARGDLRPPTRAEREAAFAEIVATLRAEPFARGRAEAALAAQAERVAAVERAVQAALLDRIEGWTAEERAAFAGRLEAELRDGPGGRSGRD